MNSTRSAALYRSFALRSERHLYMSWEIVNIAGGVFWFCVSLSEWCHGTISVLGLSSSSFSLKNLYIVSAPFVCLQQL